MTNRNIARVYQAYISVLVIVLDNRSEFYLLLRK